MFIAYIALGIATGVIAAITMLLTGSGVGMAFAAYVLGGMAGVGAGVLWALLPTGGATPHQVPQRS